jgi:integrase/recombinase XerD
MQNHDIEYIDGKHFTQTNICTFEQAKAQQSEAMWRNLAGITVAEAITYWLNTLSNLTKKNYASGMRVLSEAGLIVLDSTLQVFALMNHDAIIDRIKTLANLSEASKQARAACYISFTRFLHRRTKGVVTRAIPCREGNDKTFFKVHDKVATQAMTNVQWMDFFEELSKINKRDCLIAKIILQGVKRINEVLSLTTDVIDFDKQLITFTQSKTKGLQKFTGITYPKDVMDELKAYVGERHGLVFVTKHGKRILPYQLNVTFLKAGKQAGIPFRIHPHVLRASAITSLKSRGHSADEIQKLSGHASTAQVLAYDKSGYTINISNKVNLLQG